MGNSRLFTAHGASDYPRGFQRAGSSFLTKEDERKQVAEHVEQYLARGGIIRLIPPGYIADKKDKFMNRKPVARSYSVWRTPQFEDV